MAKVTVIIPVHNVENYIEKCVSSVTAQTFEDIEIILINDASKDKSLEICNELAAKDMRIKVISFNQNRGVSSARNIGIENTSAPYIMFIDSDDWVDKDYVKTMYETISENDYDMVCCTFSYEFEDGSPSKTNRLKKSGEFDRETAIKYCNMGYAVFGCACNKIIKTALAGRFDVNVSIGEDYTFAIEYLKKSKKVYQLDMPLYHYLQRKTSATYKGYNDSYIKNLKNFDKICNSISAEYPNAKTAAIYYRAVEQMGTVTAMIKGNTYNYPLIADIQKSIRQNFVTLIFKLPGKPFEKTAFLLMAISKHLFVFVGKVFLAITKSGRLQ